MIHYFSKLPKDYDLTFDDNIKLSNGIMYGAQSAFTPFYQYLDTTIKSLEKKEDVKASWKQLKKDNLVNLKLKGSINEILKETKIKLNAGNIGLYKLDGDFEKDFDEPLIYWIDGKKEKLNISPNNFIENNILKLHIDYTKFDKVRWAGDDLKLIPQWVSLSKNDKLKCNNKEIIVTEVSGDIATLNGFIAKGDLLFFNDINLNFSIDNNSDVPKNGIIIDENEKRYVVYIENSKDRSDLKLLRLINWNDSKDDMLFSDGSKFIGVHQDNSTFEVKDKNSVIGKVLTCFKLTFLIEDLQNNNKDKYWIQLEEIEKEKEDIPGFSPLKYFFDDDIIVKDSAGNEYTVAHGNDSEHRVVLKTKPTYKDKNKRPQYTFPKKGDIEVKVNTYQLQKQLEAVITLQNMPVREHSNLIKLFEDRKRVNWKETEYNHSEIDWQVLKDGDRSGSIEQRNFVEQALNTPDFAILEGPPGSGKTTVILELISQLSKLGKRVLLCGSTHVAIDNVLERLKETDSNGRNLIENFDILPVRIGDKSRINDDIAEFQIDNQKTNLGISEDLLLDSANLVCGTTIGILQHPHFKNRRSYNKKSPRFDKPVVPEFDYLIIDESSKTTFQEFLVPAIYAKKWILAGDIKQLSPFTDREQVVSNIENLQLKDNKVLPKENQVAVYYWMQLKEMLGSEHKNRYILQLKKSMIDAVYKEFQKRVNQENKEDVIVTVYEKRHSKLELIGSNIILIEEKDLDRDYYKMPETHAVLSSESWKNTEHSFSHNSWQNRGRNKFHARYRKGQYNSSYEIVEHVNKAFVEKSWAEEIAWRIDREYQLRMLGEGKTEFYGSAIKELLPLAIGYGDKIDLENRLNTLASVAFPSILESLVNGIKGRKSAGKTSTISEGFTKEELEIRRTVLKYQHRMHPEISKFPRERFYKDDNALLDLEKPKPIAEGRQWDYYEYQNRTAWVDVKGETFRNSNSKEVTTLSKELKSFIEFASKNKHPEGKEWSVACLTFYTGQEKKIRESLQSYTGLTNAFSNFSINNGNRINIKLHTIDKFQGHEADIVFISMVQTNRDGFMDNPNRLNVAITRAKYQLVLIGDYDYFSERSRSEDLKQLALNTQKQK